MDSPLHIRDKTILHKRDVTMQKSFTEDETVLSPRKVMVSVFWDSKRVVLVLYSEKGKTTS